MLLNESTDRIRGVRQEVEMLFKRDLLIVVKFV